MIFVTVGTTRFERLIREVDRLAAAGVVAEPVRAQTGNGQYEPSHLECVRYVDDIEREFRAASLVICHGGSGTVFALLRLGRPFIAVPNRELADDHQSDLLRRLEQAGWCRVCWRLEELEQVLRRPVRRRPYDPPATLGRAVWDFLCVPPGAGSNGRWSGSHVCVSRLRTDNGPVRGAVAAPPPAADVAVPEPPAPAEPADTLVGQCRSVEAKEIWIPA